MTNTLLLRNTSRHPAIQLVKTGRAYIPGFTTGDGIRHEKKNRAKESNLSSGLNREGTTPNILKFVSKEHFVTFRVTNIYSRGGYSVLQSRFCGNTGQLATRYGGHPNLDQKYVAGIIDFFIEKTVALLKPATAS